MELTCPKCHGRMRSYERNRVVVDQCTECRGIFLDRGELETLLDAEAAYNTGAAPVTQPYAAASGAPGPLMAPSGPPVTRPVPRPPLTVVPPPSVVPVARAAVRTTGEPHARVDDGPALRADDRTGGRADDRTGGRADRPDATPSWGGDEGYTEHLQGDPLHPGRQPVHPYAGGAAPSRARRRRSSFLEQLFE